MKRATRNQYSSNAHNKFRKTFVNYGLLVYTDPFDFLSEGVVPTGLLLSIDTGLLSLFFALIPLSQLIPSGNSYLFEEFLELFVFFWISGYIHTERILL